MAAAGRDLIDHIVVIFLFNQSIKSFIYMKKLLSLALVAMMATASVSASTLQHDKNCNKECCKKCDYKCKEACKGEKCAKEECAKKCEKSACSKKAS